MTELENITLLKESLGMPLDCTPEELTKAVQKYKTEQIRSLQYFKTHPEHYDWIR